MRINHNISSMITQNAMARVNHGMAKTLEKLSTGMRINTAADDAAGLGVSENLRTQVRGMGQALKNTQDAIALLNIADGALNEQNVILQRMRELTLQAKNDTYGTTERQYMGQEFVALRDELDRIAVVTNYNGMQLFAAPEQETGGAEYLYAVSNVVNAPRDVRNGNSMWTDPTNYLFSANDFSSSHHFNMQIGADYSAGDMAALNAGYNSFEGGENIVTIQLGQMDANALLSLAIDPLNDATLLFDDFEFHIGNPGDYVDDEDDMFNAASLIATGQAGTVQTKLDALLRIIDGGTQLINPTDPNPALANTIHTIVFSDGENVTGIQRVNTMRAKIGAMVNRLEHSATNLQNQLTNTQSAESIIRDTDFASEAANLTRGQILSQSSVAMLSQANMLPQNVLTLLR